MKKKRFIGVYGCDGDGHYGDDGKGDADVGGDDYGGGGFGAHCDGHGVVMSVMAVVAKVRGVLVVVVMSADGGGCWCW